MRTYHCSLLAAGFALYMALSAAGCGETPSTPKTELNDQEKQQLIELNEQRTKEWSGK